HFTEFNSQIQEKKSEKEIRRMAGGVSPCLPKKLLPLFCSPAPLTGSLSEFYEFKNTKKQNYF
ncbi:MAG: hypothetical protein Athens071412_790, partial [Parcubacteria group bacterium Athens0714_12]